METIETNPGIETIISIVNTAVRTKRATHHAWVVHASKVTVETVTTMAAMSTVGMECRVQRLTTVVILLVATTVTNDAEGQSL